MPRLRRRGCRLLRAGQADDLMPLLQQPRRHRAAYVAGCTGDEYPHGLGILCCRGASHPSRLMLGGKRAERQPSPWNKAREWNSPEDAMDRARRIEAFVQVIDAGSFSAAARAMKLSPSAVSKLMSRIEEQLGVRLVDRSTRQLRLTPEGELYYQRCVRIVSEIEDAEQALSEHMSRAFGPLARQLVDGHRRASHPGPDPRIPRPPSQDRARPVAQRRGGRPDGGACRGRHSRRPAERHLRSRRARSAKAGAWWWLLRPTSRPTVCR